MSEDQDSSLEPAGKRTPPMRVCGGVDARAGGFSGWTPTLRAAPHARGAGLGQAGRLARMPCRCGERCDRALHPPAPHCRPGPGRRAVRDLAAHLSHYGTLPRPAVRDELKGLGFGIARRPRGEPVLIDGFLAGWWDWRAAEWLFWRSPLGAARHRLPRPSESANSSPLSAPRSMTRCPSAAVTQCPARRPPPLAPAPCGGRAQARTPGVTRGSPSFGTDGFAARAPSRLRRSRSGSNRPDNGSRAPRTAGTVPCGPCRSTARVSRTRPS